MLFRAVALLVTAFVLSDGSGTEGNPLYHSVSALYFVIFMFMSMAIVYGILWAVPMSSRLRLFLGSIVTVGSGYDMIHDIFYLFYQQDPIVYLWYHYV